jgi:hypothetical protein
MPPAIAAPSKRARPSKPRGARVFRRLSRWADEEREARVIRATDTTLELEIRQPSGAWVRGWFDRRSGEGMRNRKGGDRSLAMVQFHDWRGWRLAWDVWSQFWIDREDE